ncbi:MAG: MBL fold metallo-hydrolase [Mycobacterium sp.]|nr:MBL fold metallo-hydrolase [Mycobacterium sp.]
MEQTKVTALPVLGRGNVNAFMLRGRKAVLVDTGTPGSGPRILGMLNRCGVRPGDVSAIIVTHGHIDHFGSAAELRRVTRAPILAHQADLGAYAMGRSSSPLRPTGPFGRLFAALPPIHQSTEPFAPDELIDDGYSLAGYGVDARVLHTPGHTPGSTSVITESGAVVAGDLVAGSFLGAIPNRPALPPFHADRAGNLASLERVLALGPEVIYVGHGGPLDPVRVRRWAARERRELARRSRMTVDNHELQQ